MQDYSTIDGSATARIEEKKSEFIAHTSFADTEEKALAILNTIRAEHRTAAHNVYAYLLRQDARMRYSDDGEPAKTSGLPTLEAIRHAGITDCIIVTTRYFGGTLLGTGGLVRAYTEAASRAIEAAKKVTVSVIVAGNLTIDYALYEIALRLLAESGAKCDAPVFTDKVAVPFRILSGREEALLPKLLELCRGVPEITLSEPFYAPF